MAELRIESATGGGSTGTGQIAAYIIGWAVDHSLYSSPGTYVTVNFLEGDSFETIHEKAAAAIRSYASPYPVSIRFTDCPGQF